MKFKYNILIILLLFSCQHSKTSNEELVLQQRNVSNFEKANEQGKKYANNVTELPQLLNTDELIPEFETVLKKESQLSDQNRKLLAERLAKYMGFLGLSTQAKNNSMQLIDSKDSFERLLNSSTQFLVCSDFNNWSCLESKPILSPKKSFRKEQDENLGKAVVINRPLEPNLQYYFTNQFDLPKDKRDPSYFLSLKLSAIIKSENWDEISMALYGVDEIKNSMKPFYEAIVEQQEKGTIIKGVFDNMGVDGKDKIIFTHRGDVTSDSNIFKKNNEGVRPLKFQYEDTPSLIETLNKNCATEKETLARLEWPPSADIMHNKFIVFKKDNKLSVWTGTANISQTCMGEESNSNMVIYIKDSQIAESFLTEFNEMFNFDSTPISSNRFRANHNEQIWGGKFHQNKTPNTNRYFIFNDDHEVKLHFSPTDDGEHRVLIPLILSAQNGDELRISMFGHGGIEFVRALQYAEAKGVQIKVFLDTATMYNSKSWVAKNSYARLQDINPYTGRPISNMQILRNKWGNQNHHKTATLTRNKKGKKRVETLVIGSQNWSKSGNDNNDENMLTIRRLKNSLKAGEAFNEHFDKRLWPNGVVPKLQ